MAVEIPARASEQIRDHLFAGRKIDAIKLYRESIPGTGLKEAKDAVDAFEANLRATAPEKFSKAPSRVGCTPVFLAIVAVAAIALVAWLIRK